MTPRMSLDELQSIAESLASGFECLSQLISEYQKKEQTLQLRLQAAITKHQRLEHSGNSSSAAISDWHDEIVNQIHPAPSEYEPLRPSQAADGNILKAKIALGRLRRSAMPSKVEVRTCPIAHHVRDQEDFERDFTVPGKPSDLGCPFAQSGKVASATSEDPIAAEFHGDKSSTRSQDAGSRCPIRFLDQHSPEEIAKYFENHKHEIPRSHQICVKRYQQDEQSIRHLDAKYGNIVSMIQGLGNKHKQYLPGDGHEPPVLQQGNDEAVEKWAENVSQHSAPENAERIPRFEKTLRDIRVGESPSRPWGIPVPIDKSPPASVEPLEGGKAQSAKPPSSHPAVIMPDLGQNNDSHQQHTGSAPSPQRTQIIFNGPVFFGYGPEQAAVFLQHLNGTGKD